MRIRGGGVLVILDNISIATRPVRPKAVVWYKPGRFSKPHCRIFSGESGLRYALTSSRFSIELGGSGGAEEEPCDMYIKGMVVVW
jgi:hypothetical protein